MRTDIHRPSAIQPEDYDFVAFDYRGGSDLGAILMLKNERARLDAHMAQTKGSFSSHEHGGSCYVCGAHALYLVIFYHAKTNAYIKTGEDCARKMDLAYGDMNPFRRAIHSALDRNKGKAKAQAILESFNLSRAWDIYIATKTRQAEAQTGFATQEELAVEDIVGKVVKYGSFASDKQRNFLAILVDRVDNRVKRDEERKARWAAERAVAQDCPTGRVEISGLIIKAEDKETQFGLVRKMVVKDYRGFLVYSTVPSGVDGIKGDKITFVATVTPSPNDKKFGFGKRPLLKVAAVQSQPEAISQ